MTQDATSWIRDGIGMIDLWYQDTPWINAAYLFDIGDGFVLVETGPASGVQRLLNGIRALGRDPADLRAILLTHIHLDHAGATGSLLRLAPQVEVYVHEIGAPHLIDPSALLRSAERIYGDQMDALWGTTLPVPEDAVTPITHGTVLPIGTRVFDVLYTPGHASHHVAYIDRDTRFAVVGDVAGVRIPPSALVWPPTPPPDFNLEQWRGSISRLRAADPMALLISHVGIVERDVIRPHLDALETHLSAWVDLVARRVAAGWDRDAIVEELARRSQEELHAERHGELATSFAMATPYGMSVDGILRYLRKKAEQR